MQIICFRCTDGRNNHCDGCNIFKYSISPEPEVMQWIPSVDGPLYTDVNGPHWPGNCVWKCSVCGYSNGRHRNAKYCPECGRKNMAIENRQEAEIYDIKIEGEKNYET